MKQVKIETMTSHVSARDLSVRFGAVEVLKSLNLDIQKGEFLVLLGASGCGKSTLLNTIAGLQEATEGQIWINDENVTWREPKDRGLAMVFQSYARHRHPAPKDPARSAPRPPRP